MKYQHEDENVRIRIHLRKHKSILANAEVVLKTTGFGWYAIRTYIIWQSSYFHSRLQENINITPPRRKGDKDQDITFMKETSDWYELERLIYSAYLKERNEKDVESLEDIEIDN